MFVITAYSESRNSSRQEKGDQVARVISGVRRLNEVNARRARLVPAWMGDRLRAGIPSRYVTSQLGQLSLASPGGA